MTPVSTLALADTTIPDLRTGPRIDLHPGLTDVDTAWINAAIAAGRAESTRATYASAWRGFERWSAANEITALPALPVTVCA